MSERLFESLNESGSAAAGKTIAHLLPSDAVIHLIGDLGAGKTFLVRAIAAALGADPTEVSSPTFALVHEYPVEGKAPIRHLDGYRLSERPKEWLEIGIPDLLRAEGLKFIEWPRQEFSSHGQRPITIEVRVNPDDSRTIRVEGLP